MAPVSANYKKLRTLTWKYQQNGKLDLLWMVNPEGAPSKASEFSSVPLRRLHPCLQTSEGRETSPFAAPVGRAGITQPPHPTRGVCHVVRATALSRTSDRCRFMLLPRAPPFIPRDRRRYPGRRGEGRWQHLASCIHVSSVKRVTGAGLLKIVQVAFLSAPPQPPQQHMVREGAGRSEVGF